MQDDPAFTLYWRTGRREVVRGRNGAEAMTLAGYSSGALRALDFWADGDDDKYWWDEKNREWHSKEIMPQPQMTD